MMPRSHLYPFTYGNLDAYVAYAMTCGDLLVSRSISYSRHASRAPERRMAWLSWLVLEKERRGRTSKGERGAYTFPAT